jgi:hypothetical protein
VILRAALGLSSSTLVWLIPELRDVRDPVEVCRLGAQSASFRLTLLAGWAGLLVQGVAPVIVTRLAGWDSTSVALQAWRIVAFGLAPLGFWIWPFVVVRAHRSRVMRVIASLPRDALRESIIQPEPRV